MSDSARIFACFVDWCASAELNASDYRITIIPLSSDADLCLRQQWYQEWELRNLSPGSLPYRPNFEDGFIMGVPFRIERFK